MAAPATTLSIGQVAERSGFSVATVRFYEEQGLITSSRTGGGHRVFPRSALRRLAFIRAASTVGLSLAEIRSELDTLPGGRTPTKADWSRMSRHWRHYLDEQIAALEQLRDGLDGCIGCGCLSLRSCAVFNNRDELAEDGPGARRLPPALRPSPHERPASR